MKWINDKDNDLRDSSVIFTQNIVIKYLNWKSSFQQLKSISKCFIVSFGSKQTSGMAMISVDLDTDIDKFPMHEENRASKGNFSWTEHRANLHDSSSVDNCFLAFIGGEYVDLLILVMEKIQSISKKIGLSPIGIFITDDQNVKTKYSVLTIPLVNNQTVSF